MNRIFAITDNAVAKLQNTLPMRESGHTQVCFIRLPCTHHCHDLCETIMMILRCSWDLDRVFDAPNGSQARKKNFLQASQSQ
jgi:predicted amino acid racemase